MMRQKEIHLSRVYAIPLIFTLVVIPLVTFVTVYKTDIGENTWMAGEAFYDFFLYYKSRLLMFMALAVAVLFTSLLMCGKQGNLVSKGSYACLIPAGVFLFFSFLSAMTSQQREDAVFGGYEQFEGLFVLIGYVLCFAFVYVYATRESWVNMLLYALLIGSLLVSLTGALQYIGKDYMTEKKMIPLLTMFLKNVPERFRISLNFGTGVSYATLYNPNYVGSYVALVLPVTAVLIFFAKNIGFRIVAAASVFLQLVMLWGAQSMAGVIGVAGMSVVIVVFWFSDIRKNKWFLLSGLLVLVGVATYILLNENLINRFTDTEISNYDYTIESMITKGDSIEIALDNGGKVIVKTKAEDSFDDFELVGADGTRMPIVKNDKMTIENELYKDLIFENILIGSGKETAEESGQSYHGLRISTSKGKSWDFLKMEGMIYYVNGYNKLDQLRNVDKFGFEHNYDLATNRGYIWSRTLPLMKDTVFLGKGADNFTYAFPNDDYVGKVNCGYGPMVVTKPHNMYMQIWVQDGMPACLAFILLYFGFAVCTFRRCFVKGKLSYMQKLQIAILCGTTGYMIAGLANDSTICVAPIFWILLGLGYAVNTLNVSSKRQEKISE